VDSTRSAVPKISAERRMSSAGTSQIRAASSGVYGSTVAARSSNPIVCART
jgi:hypothetical protein